MTKQLVELESYQHVSGAASRRGRYPGRTTETNRRVTRGARENFKELNKELEKAKKLDEVNAEFEQFGRRRVKVRNRRSR